MIYQSSFQSGAVKTSHTIKLAAEEMLTCHWPDGPAKACVMFCHGLGGSGRAYEGLTRVWAAHGYLVIHPTFPDWIGTVAAADPALGLDLNADSLSSWAAIPKVRARMIGILLDPAYCLDRIRIVRQVLQGLDTVLAATCGASTTPIPCAIAGHSFGAYTAQLLAGAEVDLAGHGTCRFHETQLKAAILLSAQGHDQQGLREGSWDAMTGPVLTVTGTDDHGAKGQDWQWKSEPYKLAPPGGKYLAVLKDGDHFLGGIQLADPRAGIPDQHHAVAQLTLAFLDAHLMQDQAAKSWLASVSDHIGPCPLLFQRK